MGHRLAPLSIHGRDDGGRRVISPSSQKTLLYSLPPLPMQSSSRDLHASASVAAPGPSAREFGFSIASLASPGTAWWTGLLQRSS